MRRIIGIDPGKRTGIALFWGVKPLRVTGDT